MQLSGRRRAADVHDDATIDNHHGVDDHHHDAAEVHLAGGRHEGPGRRRVAATASCFRSSASGVVDTPCSNQTAATGTPILGANVVIDPGHGGNEPGAVGPTGLIEKDVNFDVSQDVKQQLEAEGAKVVLTRTGRLQHDDQDPRRDRGRSAPAGLHLDPPQRRAGRTVGRSRQRELLPNRQPRLEATGRPVVGGDHRGVLAAQDCVGGRHRPRRQVPAEHVGRRLLRHPPARSGHHHRAVGSGLHLESAGGTTPPRPRLPPRGSNGHHQGDHSLPRDARPGLRLRRRPIRGRSRPVVAAAPKAAPTRRCKSATARARSRAARGTALRPSARAGWRRRRR